MREKQKIDKHKGNKGRDTQESEKGRESHRVGKSGRPRVGNEETDRRKPRGKQTEMDTERRKREREREIGRHGEKQEHTETDRWTETQRQ